MFLIHISTQFGNRWHMKLTLQDVGREDFAAAAFAPFYIERHLPTAQLKTSRK